MVLHAEALPGGIDRHDAPGAVEERHLDGRRRRHRPPPRRVPLRAPRHRRPRTSQSAPVGPSSAPCRAGGRRTMRPADPVPAPGPTNRTRPLRRGNGHPAAAGGSAAPPGRRRAPTARTATPRIPPCVVDFRHGHQCWPLAGPTHAAPGSRLDCALRKADDGWQPPRSTTALGENDPTTMKLQTLGDASTSGWSRRADSPAAAALALGVTMDESSRPGWATSSCPTRHRSDRRVRYLDVDADHYRGLCLRSQMRRVQSSIRNGRRAPLRLTAPGPIHGQAVAANSRDLSGDAGAARAATRSRNRPAPAAGHPEPLRGEEMVERPGRQSHERVRLHHLTRVGGHRRQLDRQVARDVDADQVGARPRRPSAPTGPTASGRRAARDRPGRAAAGGARARSTVAS